MLSPDQRKLFLNAIRPPQGYQFDRAVGTTFTLDLVTLLITPLSFALWDQSNTEEALQDSLVLLEGLHRNADRLTIFCQAGRISIPRKANFLYRHLENMVVEVQAPGPGVFHPKVWLLRYIADGFPVRYRLINMSRNLTFDKSWDIILTMEGDLPDRRVGYSRNRPLSDFIGQLPDLAINPVEQRILDDIALIEEEIRKVPFKASYPFFADSIRFHPSGIPGYRGFRFNQNIWRLLVVSPFLAAPLLRQITRLGKDHVLISRLDSIDKLPEPTRNRFEQIFVLDDMADQEPEDQEYSDELNEEVDEREEEEEIELTGLHAKAFVLEDRYNATWLLGSANATDAAYRGRNVEFMIELSGRKSKIGINKILDEDESDSKDTSLFSLLKPYPDRIGRIQPDDDKHTLGKLADSIRDWLIRSELTLTVMEDENDLYLLQLNVFVSPAVPDGNYNIYCWPINIDERYRQELMPKDIDRKIEFKSSLVNITPFFGFIITSRHKNLVHSIRFVLNLPVEGIPPDRDDQIYFAIIQNQDQFLRYLRLLLAEHQEFGLPQELILSGGSGEYIHNSFQDGYLPLLEDLVRALSRYPEEKIDRISDIVDRLKKTPDGAAIIPEDFDELWDKIVEARREV